MPEAEGVMASPLVHAHCVQEDRAPEHEQQQLQQRARVKPTATMWVVTAWACMAVLTFGVCACAYLTAGISSCKHVNNHH